MPTYHVRTPSCGRDNDVVAAINNEVSDARKDDPPALAQDLIRSKVAERYRSPDGYTRKGDSGGGKLVEASAETKSLLGGDNAAGAYVICKITGFPLRCGLL